MYIDTWIHLKSTFWDSFLLENVKRALFGATGPNFDFCFSPEAIPFIHMDLVSAVAHSHRFTQNQPLDLPIGMLICNIPFWDPMGQFLFAYDPQLIVLAHFEFVSAVPHQLHRDLGNCQYDIMHVYLKKKIIDFHYSTKLLITFSWFCSQ